jgi:hypothetical protein
MLLKLGLLDAKNIRVKLIKGCKEFLFNHSAQAVYVPGD